MNKFYLLLLLSIFYLSSIAQTSEAYKWKSAAMGGGGFVSAVIASEQEQNLYYARTDVGGAYRWIHQEQSWKPLNDWVSENEVGLLGIESLALDPQNPSRVYMLAGISYFNYGKTAILISDDYGDTYSAIIDVTSQFKAHGNGMGRQTGERLAVDPNHSSTLFCGTRRDGLFKSTDAGLTWQKVNSFPVSTTPNDNGICIVEFDKSTGTIGSATQRIFVGVSRMGNTNFYKTEDGGSTWTAIADQPTSNMPHRMSISSDGYIYITYGNGAGPHGYWAIAEESMDRGEIWKYNISTGDWQNITPTGYTKAFGGISVDPQNANRIVASTINTYMNQPWGWGDRIFVSENGGATWTDMFAQNKIAMDNNGIPWIDGHAIHWAGCITIDPFDSDHVFVTSGNGIFATSNLSDNVSTWKFTVKGIEETVPLDIISIPDGPIISVIGDYDGSRYDNMYTFPTLHNPQIGTTTGIDFARQNTNYIVRVGGDDRGENFPLYYSNDMGTTWTAFASTPENSLLYKGAVAVASDASAVLWSPENSSTLYRTTNNGGSWSISTGVTITNGYPVADPINPDKFYIFNNSSGAFLTSTNGGADFSQTATISSGDFKKIRLVPNKEGDIWVPAQGNGLYRSINSGANFSKISNINTCSAVGFGKAADGSVFPAIYIWGSANGGPVGIYRSDDEGANWIRVNDDANEFGGPANGQFIIGDMNVYGRVLMSSAGRGIIVGEPLGTADCKYPSLGGNKVLCETTRILLDANISDPEYYFEWLHNNISTGENAPTLEISEAGEYTVIVTKEGCEQRTISTNVSSNLLEVANDTVCEGEIATLRVLSIGDFNWYSSADGDEIVFQGSDYEFTANAPIIYYIEDANRSEYYIALEEPNYDSEDTWSVNQGFDEDMNQMSLEISETIMFDGFYLNITTASTNLVCSIISSSGVVVKEITQVAMPLGLQYVNINQILAPDTYTVSFEGTTGGFRMETDATGATMQIPGYVVLNHIYAWHGPMYNLKFSVGNTCARTPVSAIIKENCESVPTQTIELQVGWNLVSTYIIAEDDSIKNIFSELNISEIKTGDKYFSVNNPNFLNSLSIFEPGIGYMVYSNENQTLRISGTPIMANQIDLSTGWNLIGVPSNEEIDVNGFLNVNGFEIIKDFDNFKDANDGQLQYLMPGKAYFVKMSMPGVVTRQ